MGLKRAVEREIETGRQRETEKETKRDRGRERERQRQRDQEEERERRERERRKRGERGGNISCFQATLSSLFNNLFIHVIIVTYGECLPCLYTALC